MRKALALILASTFLTATPVVPQPVEAASLFEALFPRAAERRRERRTRRFEQRQREMDRLFEQQRRIEARERRKARQAERVVSARVEGESYKTYLARKIAPVALTKLGSAFSAHDQKLMAAFALQQEKQKQESKPAAPDLDGDSTGSLDNGGANPVPVSQSGPPVAAVQLPLVPEAKLPAVRLSAGANLLSSIALKASPALGTGLINYYKKHPQFIWLDEEGKPTAKATAMLQELARASDYGLNPADYSVDALTVADNAADEDVLRAAMKFEFATSAAVLQYMMDARHGIVDPNRISGYHDFKGLSLDFSRELNALAGTERPMEVLLAAHPKDESFKALKAELAKLRKQSAGFDSVTIAPGTFLKPGVVSDQLENVVESIRRKASEELLASHFDVFALDHSDGVYTDEVADMVRDFQREVNLKPDGIVGRNTIARMNVDDPKVQMNKVLYAMERLRWHPDSFGATHVFINQPAYRATFVKNWKPELAMNTVVGKPSNQTYFFHDKIEYVEFNPYWGIPRSILVNEMLPKLRRNPSYFDNIGYEMTNSSGRRVSSSSVDWYGVGANFPFNVRQPPGNKNALGELKIMFPNSHSIYMHDTPAKSLFSKPERAYSHGCVRLAEPRKMAAAVLGTTMDDIESQLWDRQNKQQRLKVQIPVYVSYFTAWPEAGGKIAFYKDVYGRDAALEKALAAEARARENARGA